MKTMTNNTRKLFLALSLAGIFTGYANAAIIFTETSDFSGNLGSPFILPESLGIGDNIITGTLPGDFGFEDGDVFYINNPSQLSVASISIAISGFVGTATDPGNGSGTLRLEAPGFDQVAPLSNGQFSLVPSVSNATQFQFRFFGPSDIANMEAGSMNYQVTLNAVPEPSSALLFGTFALAAVLGRKRRA